MNIRMPDGTTINNIPEGTSKEAVMAKYESMPGNYSNRPSMTGEGSFTPDNPPLVERPYMPELLSNVPSSASKYATDTVQGVKQLVTHPIDTAKQVRPLLNGIAEAVGFNPFGVDLRSDEQTAAVADMLIKRYGSVNAFANTFKTDPVGVLGDLSAVVATPTALTSKLAKVGGMNKVATTAGKVADIANMADPINLAVKGAGKAIGAVGRSGLPKWMMDKSIKPGVNATGDANTGKKGLVATLLEHNISPTQKGYNKRLGEINKNKDLVNDLIHGELAGVTLRPSGSDTYNIYKPRGDFYKKYLDPKSGTNTQKAQRIVDSIRDSLPKTEDMTLSGALELKRNLQSEANYKNPMFQNKIADDYRKSIATTLDGYISSKVTEVDNWGPSQNKAALTDYTKSNEIMSELLDIDKPHKAAINKMNNRSVLSPSNLISAGIGYGIGGVPGGLVGELLNQPQSQAFIAQQLYNAKNLGNKGPLLKPPVKTAVDIAREQEELRRQMKQ